MPLVGRLIKVLSEDVAVQAMVIGLITGITYYLMTKRLSGEVMLGMRVQEIARALGAKRFKITWSG